MLLRKSQTKIHPNYVGRKRKVKFFIVKCLALIPLGKIYQQNPITHSTHARTHIYTHTQTHTCINLEKNLTHFIFFHQNDVSLKIILQEGRAEKEEFVK